VRHRSKGALHLCEMHGAHWDVAAVGYIISTTYVGQRVHVWGCDACKLSWLQRHPEAVWHEWPRTEDPV
jgi:hypothetical protein